MITWSVDPVALSLGPLQIRWYGILFLSGFYLGLYYLQKISKLESKPPEKIESLLIYAIIGTTVGARLAHCLFYEWDYYSQNLLEIFMIWKGGLASHGGGTGLIIGIYLFSRKNKEFPFMWLLDRSAVPLALAGSFIRLGNLMNSEIIGRPTDLPWSFIFTRIDMVPRHPSQIYESLCYFAIWLSGLFWYKKYKNNPPKGLLFGWTVAMIFTARFFIELVKENQEAFESAMTFNMGQLLSIPFLLIGYGMFIRALLVKKEAPLETSPKFKKKGKK